MEIEIISTENIKPSSSTPQNLRNFNISLLDQITPPIRIPIILYFPHNKNGENFISESTKTLKQSLSKLLTRFYPFAGRIKDHLSVDCNDEGFLFVVAKVKSSLSDFLKKPDHKENTRLLPCKLDWSEASPGSHVALAQVNYFDCGGMAIGFVFSHKVADGVTMCSFIKSWSLYAYAGCTDVVCPNYIAQSLFPHSDSMEIESDMNSTMMSYLKIGKTIMRRYVFDSRAISTLKAKSSNIYRLSRVEVVTAFLWKCFMLANKSSGKLTLVTQAVNLRRKAEPPLPENCFGNFFWLAAATCKHEEGVNDDEVEKELVMKLRDEIRKIDDEFITRMHGVNGLSGYYRNFEETLGKYPDKESTEVLSVTSWCNFGLYNVDFGWGKPMWLNNCSGGNDTNSPYMNIVWLIDTKNGDGVEAWVTLEEQYMRVFDDIEELRVLASVDPNPFDI